MPIEIRELVIKAVVGRADTAHEKNTPMTEIKRTRSSQKTVSMVEEILKNKKER